MRDNLHRYRAIREAVTQGYPGKLHGRGARHLPTLAALLRGIGGGKSPNGLTSPPRSPMVPSPRAAANA
jgi:hypothetical protein